MKKVFRLTILISAVILILLAAANTAWADSVPNSTMHRNISMTVGGSSKSISAYTQYGDIMIDVSGLKSIGDMTAFSFSESDELCRIDVSKTNIFLADEDTTYFVKNNAGSIEIPLVWYSDRYYISFGTVAGLAGLSWEYKDDIKNNTGTLNVTKIPADGCYLNITGREDPVYLEDGAKAINACWSTGLTVSPEKIDGLDIIIMFSLDHDKRADHSAVNNAKYGCIQAAHDKGYKWWLCASNLYNKELDDCLEDRRTSRQWAAQYIIYACIYNADGINVDFESFRYSGTRNYFIDFMQTLSRHCDKLGITTSVCTNAGTSWNNMTVYPYDIFGQCCDYICEMTYSEDFSQELTSVPETGVWSVMSKNWYQSCTDYIGSLAPKEKILMGVAYYVRYEYYLPGASSRSGYVHTSNISIWEDLEGMEVTWDESVGAYYAEQPYYRWADYTQYLAKCYLEEARSSALKAQYIVDKGYGGTTGWQLGYVDLSFPQDRGIFKAYHSIYRNGGTYADFLPEKEPATGYELDQGY